MKRLFIFTTLTSILHVTTVFAQSLQSINNQAVVQNSNNALVTESQVATECGANSNFKFSLVKDIIFSPSYNSSAPRCLYKVADNKVFFCATDPATNSESLYFSDGTSAGTIMLKAKLKPKDIDSPETSSLFCTFQGKMCFVGREPTSYYYQVWVSDGTPAGTYALTSFSKDLNIDQLTAHNQKLYFKTYGGGTGTLYESNGTRNSAVDVGTLTSSELIRSSLRTWNNKLYLITFNKVFDYSNNTRKLIYTNPRGECIIGREIANGKLIYQANSGCNVEDSYRRIYEVDLQTGAERSLSSTITFNTTYNNIQIEDYRKAIVFKNAVYFYYNNNSILNEVNDVGYIYKYDGNSLTLLHTHAIDSSAFQFSGFTTDGNRLLYTINVNSKRKNQSGWSVLYETTGIASGLKKLFDKTPNEKYSNLNASTGYQNTVAILGNKVFFNADTVPKESYYSPVSTLFYHDGLTTHKILPNAGEKQFSTSEIISLNQKDVFVSAIIFPPSGFNLGREPWLLSCGGGTSIEEEIDKNTLVVYPNPTSEKIIVNSGNEIVKKINVLTQVGELILTTVDKEINLSQFTQGIYILEIECTSGIKRHKVVFTE